MGEDEDMEEDDTMWKITTMLRLPLKHRTHFAPDPSVASTTASSANTSAPTPGCNSARNRPIANPITNERIVAIVIGYIKEFRFAIHCEDRYGGILILASCCWQVD